MNGLHLKPHLFRLYLEISAGKVEFVRNKVSEISISQYGEEQLSWEYSSLVGDFYFSVTPQPVNEQVTDEKIYEFICARRKFYENASDNIY